jgi:hypothetical protein
MSFDINQIIAGFIFGGIGFIAFVYGKRWTLWKPLALGLALMIYPYFVSDTLALYAIGTALTLALYFWRN